MSSTIFDSVLHADAFSTAGVRDVFSDHATIARYVDVEVALARAEARAGVVPETAAVDIAEHAQTNRLDRKRLKRGTELVGYPILPLVEQLTELCGDAGKYIHWGATTQDIMDTALVLQLRDALGLIETDLDALRATLHALAKQYRDTPMAGRTHLQHALPVTFGYKVAVWLAMLNRHDQRLQELRPRLLVAQFAGAAGTLASLGSRGLEVQRELAKELGLGVPPITWHTARDAVAEVVQWLALTTSTLGKIAQDIAFMMATELGEAYEPFVAGRGASSTMPQKRNPISCEIISAATRLLRQHSALMLDAAVQDFERATGPWHAEWLAIPESFLAASGALTHANSMLKGLEVRPDRMASNLGMTRGLIVAEAVMMGLAEYTGRQAAHDIVYAACRKANESDLHLSDALAADERVTKHLTNDRIDALTRPENYLGLAPEMVDRVLRDRTPESHTT